jgi:hypothetical protein
MSHTAYFRSSIVERKFQLLMRNRMGKCHGFFPFWHELLGFFHRYWIEQRRSCVIFLFESRRRELLLYLISMHRRFFKPVIISISFVDLFKCNNSNMSVCPHYQRGNCRYGDRCRMPHGNPHQAPVYHQNSMFYLCISLVHCWFD